MGRLVKIKFYFFIFWIFISKVQSLHAAPCCARQGALPAFMLGEEKAQFGFGYVSSQTIAEANAEGYLNFLPSSVKDHTHLLQLRSAFLISDRVQMALGMSLVHHWIQQTKVLESSTGWGDAQLALGYEILPVWRYSAWKPQIFIFSSMAFPLGLSKYNHLKPLQSDITSNGFSSLSWGSLFLKSWQVWDVFLITEMHYGFPKEFSHLLFGNLWVYPGWGGSLGFGGGWNTEFIRIGLRIQPRVDQTTIVVSSKKIEHPEGILSICDTSLDLGFLITEGSNVTISYTDQTLLGVAMNLNVSRSLSLYFQYRLNR